MKKQEDTLVSVIIPVYKVEPYLDQCLQSVTGQTYRSLEIILVDDGSPDGCPEICDKWALRDTRIKVIHKKMGGYPMPGMPVLMRQRANIYVLSIATTG